MVISGNQFRSVLCGLTYRHLLERFRKTIGYKLLSNISWLRMRYRPIVKEKLRKESRALLDKSLWEQI